MHTSDYIAFAAAFGFGCWWLIFPRSVITFYTWFHRGKVAVPEPRGIRLAATLWIAMVAVVMAFFMMRKP
jgi:hypothetical protein